MSAILTKREQFAMAALQGMLSGPKNFSTKGEKASGEHDFAEIAVTFADALIAELEKQP